MERRRRLVLWFLSAGLATALFFQGHGAFHKGASVAFLRSPPAGCVIRLEGAVPQPGIHRFSENPDLGAVINMTAPLLTGKVANKGLFATRLQSGDIVDVVAKDREHVEITIGKMKAKERMLLGIPLNPDQMDNADWDSLPGIGPGLAQKIMDDRQKSGDFGSVESLQRVPGIGEKKLKEIRRYF